MIVVLILAYFHIRRLAYDSRRDVVLSCCYIVLTTISSWPSCMLFRYIFLVS